MFARLSIVALLAAAGMVPTPATASPPAWVQPGYGAGNTYYNPGESVINAGTIDTVRRRWTAPLATTDEWSCSGPSAPLVAGGRVFVTDDTGIAAYQAGTGRLSWRHTWEYPEDESTPRLAVAGGLLLAANQGCQSQSDPNGTIRALNVATGRETWRTATAVPLESLVVDKATAVVSGSSLSDTPQVIGIRVSDGKERWTLDDHRSTGVSVDGRLLITSTSGVGTRAVSITTGKTLWSRRTGWTAQSATGGRFYVSDTAGAMLCVSAASGAVVWTAPQKASSLIATDGRQVYRVIVNGIEALNARTGRHAWTALFEGDTSQPVRAGGLLYTAVDAGEPLGIVSAATGRVASSGRQFGSMDGGNVVVTGGWLYLTRRNSVYAYAR